MPSELENASRPAMRHQWPSRDHHSQARFIDMNRNRTEIALITRGITSDKARQLREQGWTLSKLQASDNAALLALNLSDEVIKKIRADARPAIPPETLTKVLFSNRWVCCICGDPERPVIVHHIRPWATSCDHSAENLAVLCVQHHGEAHTTRGLEITLTFAAAGCKATAGSASRPAGCRSHSAGNPVAER